MRPVFALPAIFAGLLSLTTLPLYAGDPMDDAKRKSESKPALTAPALTPMQSHVIHENGTEPPFRNAYWNNHDDGIYVDRLTGDALFSSTDKFDSGTGWPSFTKPITQQSMVYKDDHDLGMKRTEVRSDSGAHLGHVFDDGPKDKGGKRFCINSASLRFVPKAKMKEEGYENYLYLFADKK